MGLQKKNEWVLSVVGDIEKYITRSGLSNHVRTVVVNRFKDSVYKSKEYKSKNDEVDFLDRNDLVILCQQILFKIIQALGHGLFIKIYNTGRPPKKRYLYPIGINLTDTSKVPYLNYLNNIDGKKSFSEDDKILMAIEADIESRGVMYIYKDQVKRSGDVMSCAHEIKKEIDRLWEDGTENINFIHLDHRISQTMRAFLLRERITIDEHNSKLYNSISYLIEQYAAAKLIHFSVVIRQMIEKIQAEKSAESFKILNTFLDQAFGFMHSLDDLPVDDLIVNTSEDLTGSEIISTLKELSIKIMALRNFIPINQGFPFDPYLLK